MKQNQTNSNKTKSKWNKIKQNETKPNKIKQNQTKRPKNPKMAKNWKTLSLPTNPKNGHFLLYFPVYQNQDVVYIEKNNILAILAILGHSEQNKTKQNQTKSNKIKQNETKPE